MRSAKEIRESYKRARAISGTDSKGNQVEIKVGQRFKLSKRSDLIYEKAKDGSHRRVYHKPTSKQRRKLAKQRKALLRQEAKGD